MSGAVPLPSPPLPSPSVSPTSPVPTSSPQPPATPAAAALPAAVPGPLPPLRIEPLQGWHLPLLHDPAFLDLQPLLQRALLLQGPERLLRSLVPRRALAPDVLLAYRDPQRPLGLLVSERLNRSGSCWQLLHLRSGEAVLAAGDSGRMALESALVREAIQRGRGAASWIATSSSCDDARLALLRQQGFQPLRHETLWRWQPRQGGALDGPGLEQLLQALPPDLQLRPLSRRTAGLMWHLEQAALPAQLRQLLDRRVEDLLDQSQGPSLMLVDGCRQTAVAGARRLRPGSRGLPELELTLHPGWSHLLGAPLQLLLERSAAGCEQLIVRSDLGDSERSRWLQSLGMAPEGEEVVMARSVWRRHSPQPSAAVVRRLDAVLGRLQPRQRPLPTPLGR